MGRRNLRTFPYPARTRAPGVRPTVGRTPSFLAHRTGTYPVRVRARTVEMLFLADREKRPLPASQSATARVQFEHVSGRGALRTS